MVVNDGAEDSLVDHQEEQNSALHRMVFLDPYTPTLQVTIKPKYKHLLPFQTPAPGQGPNSQLWPTLIWVTLDYFKAVVHLFFFYQLLNL